jgi:sulfatase modifying factor 1
MRVLVSKTSFVWLYYLVVVSCGHYDKVFAAEESNDNDTPKDWDDEELGANVEAAHPDPNDEQYKGMIYVGKHDHETGRRLGFDQDNGIRYIFGTSFDETHKSLDEKDLLVDEHPILHETNLPNREALLKERRHKPVSETSPKPFLHIETHPLDGGVTPPKVVHVDPFFLDAHLVTNKDFGKFVRATYYETEAEKFGWSFCLVTFVDPSTVDDIMEDPDPEAPDWVAVPGTYWRRPEGPQSSYKYREEHPVVHVSHRDAAEYCKWVGKRLPGEWEWEAAARAGHYGPSNRTLYAWGDQDDWELANQHANLWGPDDFPNENNALDGWRATNPVTSFPPNPLGFYDMTGNVWEWQWGGKHKARIVRGASFVDSLTGGTTVNHAATLGARDTLHGTTTTSNVGFRCAKAPKRRTEHHYVYHDEELHGQLAMEDQYGKRDMIPQTGWEDQVLSEEDEDDDEEIMEEPTRKKKKVIKPRERYSNEL